MLPIANKMPLSDPDATTAVIKSGDPFASAIKVTLNKYIKINYFTLLMFDSSLNNVKYM